MKRLLCLSLILIISAAAVGSLTGCVDGGYSKASDGKMTAELTDIYNSALSRYPGLDIKPEKLYATQIVAGTNYKFLCKDADDTKLYVTVYRDLEGQCWLTEIADKQSKNITGKYIENLILPDTED